jgi:ATP-dependent RNA helicase DDX5/DBP2
VPPRQTLFFSATWPKEVQAIARQLCRNDPVQVFVGNVQVRGQQSAVPCHCCKCCQPHERLLHILYCLAWIFSARSSGLGAPPPHTRMLT